MSEVPTISRAGPSRLGESGFRTGLEWNTNSRARARAAEIIAEHRADRTEVVLDAHLRSAWAAHAVRSPGLLSAVQELIGEAGAVENTFLMIKWPGREFSVPWHQDGTNRRMQLDPEKSVAAWLAITDATTVNGCLQVIPGSHAAGYLPNDREESNARRGKALGVQDMPNGAHDRGVWLPLDAGQACLMDVRLLHRSDSNRTAGTRIGLNIRYVAPGAIRSSGPHSPNLYPLTGAGW
ncbi:phytanoyl-CoA dioxygenase family protein [Streptomyces sp. A3M-1-3]|uniref:phytanoyl-CoA dioxygenase family protein n=1 Tax=Streptomyces sp. A3M-1-3 TaxID=2962044 RepID=UPI0020B890CE|nr:phytanoyl-CoA dioxygenase family protein [Streptomyces sp. A3M-1-3]MCP3817960.1 phytanoyl-CoA dioxygenase family protein [Streptomyces sp. A3M-1-3]